MDKRTYEALVASVEKWRKNATVSAVNGKTGVKDCPLCDLFYWEAYCGGCPIMEATGLDMCDDTPYQDADQSRRNAIDGDEPEADWQAAAQREADFLAALVPAGGPDE